MPLSWHWLPEGCVSGFTCLLCGAWGGTLVYSATEPGAGRPPVFLEMPSNHQNWLSPLRPSRVLTVMLGLISWWKHWGGNSLWEKASDAFYCIIFMESSLSIFLSFWFLCLDEASFFSAHYYKNIPGFLISFFLLFYIVFWFVGVFFILFYTNCSSFFSAAVVKTLN